DGIHFIGYINVGVVPKLKGQSSSVFDLLPYKNILLSKGFNAITFNRQNLVMKEVSAFTKAFRKLRRTIFHLPNVFQYRNVIKSLVGIEDTDEDNYPIVIPNWDHTPRSNYGGIVWKGSTPNLYKNYLDVVLHEIVDKQSEHQIIFLKSWNEWGEGNYIEPDLRWGRQYLEATKEALDSFMNI
ncbi:MAG: glycoside hydrolase family 99-like domain-containing protein, partial [Acholeplasmatales bacterium]|nr:glycoside hydrolase family 99-like domain-containing protein [Acholeplasmatales bacterium]